MSGLAFLSPAACDPGVVRAGALEQAELGGVVREVPLGKLELRGALEGLAPPAGTELLPLAPGRALLVGAVEGHAEALRTRGLKVYDLSDGLTALEFEGRPLLAALTELEPDELPAIGAFARGTRALVEALGEERYRAHVPRELARFVAEFVADAAGVEA